MINKNKKTLTKNKKNTKKTQKNNKFVGKKPSDDVDFFVPNFYQNNKSITSYSPTVNKDLITLKTTPRQSIKDCNNKSAFELKEPLKIGVPGFIYGNNCYKYSSNEAIKFLLKNLSANKHVNVSQIIPPKQIESNCWFNAMFVLFFVSDKGRKFFHYFRQLMIKGTQKNGEIIPENLRDAFALLNFGIEACLTGNKYAYELNSNSIIHKIFESIPDKYKNKYSYIVDVKNGSNPLRYYLSIINYLNNNSITFFIINNPSNWKKQLLTLNKSSKMPHIIVFEIFDIDSPTFLTKPLQFKINNATYKLDSAVVRDVTKQHFCCTITCEKQEMGYDGMSFHRIVPLEWKNKINKDFTWSFEGSVNNNKKPLEWNFTKSYYMLFYYRV